MSEVARRRDFYRGVLSDIHRQCTTARDTHQSLEFNLQNMTKAREVILVVVSTAQQTAKSKIESLVTAAIQSVYDRPFEFELRFKQQRNRSVAAPIIKEGDIEYDAKEDLGGGMLDIISFALRVVVWSMRDRLTRNFMVFDEPMKFVGTGALMDRAAEFMKRVSLSLGIQFLIITHNQQLAEIGDKVWDFKHEEGRTKVEERN